MKAGGKELLRKEIGKQTVTEGWLDLDIDLSAFAGKTVNVELLNHPDEWSWEAGYWARIAIESK